MLSYFARIFSIFGLCWCAILPAYAQIVILPSTQGAIPSGALNPAEMRQMVAKASEHGMPWSGPVNGPPGQPGATIAIICEDLRNGGILGVTKGIKEAANVMGLEDQGLRQWRHRSRPSRRKRCRASIKSKRCVLMI